MPSKKTPCPTCGRFKSQNAQQCRRCKPSYDRTDEHRKAMSAASAGKPKPHLKGRKRPDHSAAMREFWSDPERRAEAKARGDKLAADPEWRRRIASAVSGDKNPRWRGGVSNKQYAPGFSRKLKRAIRERDGFRCQLCGDSEAELGYKLSVHHSDYDKSNHDPANLFATCKRCNSRANTNPSFWSARFAALAEARGKLGEDVSQLVGRKVVTQREGFVGIREAGHPGGFAECIAAALADG